MKDEIEIGKFLRKRRKEAKMTQQELAEASGVDQYYISLVENGKKNITVDTLAKICAPLGVEITFK